MRLFLILAFAIHIVSNIGLADEPGEKLDSLPLHLRLPWQRVLIIAVRDVELKAIKETLDEHHVAYEVSPSYDRNRTDYSDVFAIIACSNLLDYFREDGKNSDPEAFQHIDRFIQEGGHLFQFGVFNGQFFKNFNKHGIFTGFQHSGSVVPVPNHTEVLFAGVEEEIPVDLKILSVGHFRIDVPHVSMLRRGPPARLLDRTAFVTVPVGHGRISTTMITPFYKEQYVDCSDRYEMGDSRCPNCYGST